MKAEDVSSCALDAELDGSLDAATGGGTESRSTWRSGNRIATIIWAWQKKKGSLVSCPLSPVQTTTEQGCHGLHVFRVLMNVLFDDLDALHRYTPPINLKGEACRRALPALAGGTLVVMGGVRRMPR